VAVASEHRQRPSYGASLAVALASFAALSVAIVVVAAAAQPRVACIAVFDHCQPSFVDSVPYGLLLLTPVLCVAAVICGLAVLGTMRLFRSAVTAGAVAGSVAAALPVVAVVIGLVWLVR
jgi:hypothetical protein